MTEAVTHQMMMLRPMQAGLSGYARLQGEAGRQLVQINLRGMQAGEMRVFWYAGEGLVREVGRTTVNARGEASLSAEIPMDAAAPRRLMALLITDGADRPRPMAIGLCTAQSAGSLMDAKNALLALCDRLEREQRQQTAQESVSKDASTVQKAGMGLQHTATAGASVPSSAQGGTSPSQAQTASSLSTTQEALSPAQGKAKAMKPAQEEAPQRRNVNRDSCLPREVFLPAIEARRCPERRRSRRKEADASEPALRELGTAEEPSNKCSPMGLETASSFPVSNASSTEQPFHRQVCQDLTSVQSNRTANGVVTRADSVQSARHANPAQPAKPVTQPVQSAIQPASPAAPSRSTEPADLLPSLVWPDPFQQLAAYFDRYPPLRLLNWPGWRFVHVPQGKDGLWIGYHQKDGRITQVAYALPADATPPEGQPFRPARAADGQSIQLLVLRAES